MFLMFLVWFRFGHQHDINYQTPTIGKMVCFHVFWLTNVLWACWSSRQCTQLMVLLPCPLIGSGRMLQAGCEAFVPSCTTAGASKLLLSNVMMWRPPLPLFATLNLKCLNLLSMDLKFVQVLFHVEIQRSPWWHLLSASTKGSVPFHPAEASAQRRNGHLDKILDNDWFFSNFEPSPSFENDSQQTRRLRIWIYFKWTYETCIDAKVSLFSTRRRVFGPFKERLFLLTS